MVDIVFFYDDGTSKTIEIDANDQLALEAQVRPILTAAFYQSAESPKVTRWLIDDVRSGVALLTESEKLNAEMTVTVSTYRDYRFVPSQDGSTLSGIQSRHRHNDSWEDWAGSPDPETGLNRAIEYLSSDLDSICETVNIMTDSE